MRIKITFETRNQTTFLPINTNYYLYQLINELTHDYRRYLCALVPGRSKWKKFDLYTFSQLIIPERVIRDYEIGINSPEFYWYISSPFYQFLGILAKELRERKTVRINDKRFRVGEVNFYPSPDFSSSSARFTCLSPVAVYRKQVMDRFERNNFSMSVLPDESEYIYFLQKDLLYKHNILRNEKRDHLDLELEFDKDYLRRRRNKITKVIRLEGEDQEQIRGVLAPLSIKAEPDILRLIYDMGLGQLNNWGFGMVEKVQGAS